MCLLCLHQHPRPRPCGPLVPNLNPRSPSRAPTPSQRAWERDLVKVQASDDVRLLCQAVHLLQEVHMANVCAQIKKQVTGGGAARRTRGSSRFPGALPQSGGHEESVTPLQVP